MVSFLCSFVLWLHWWIILFCSQGNMSLWLGCRYSLICHCSIKLCHVTAGTLDYLIACKNSLNPTINHGTYGKHHPIAWEVVAMICHQGKPFCQQHRLYFSCLIMIIFNWYWFTSESPSSSLNPHFNVNNISIYNFIRYILKWIFSALYPIFCCNNWIYSFANSA